MNNIQIFNNLYDKNLTQNRIYANYDYIEFNYLNKFVQLDYIFFTDFTSSFKIYDFYSIDIVYIKFIFDTTEYILNIDDKNIKIFDQTITYNKKDINITISDVLNIYIDNTNVFNIDVSNQSHYILSIYPNGKFKFKISTDYNYQDYTNISEIYEIVLNNELPNKIKDINNIYYNTHTNIYEIKSKYLNINIDNYILYNNNIRMYDIEWFILNIDSRFRAEDNSTIRKINPKIYDMSNNDVDIILYNNRIIY